jgi:single-stranded-DNA-specific exonuclease
LAELRRTQRPGLKSLADMTKLDLNQLQAWQVGYYLAPRLNAMARLSQALDSVRLLCTHDPHKANNFVKVLEQINQDRQTLTQDMLNHAQKQYRQQDQSQSLIFIQDKSYHEAIVGLVASRLVDQYHKPAIVVAIGQNYSKASARSIPGFNAIKAIRRFDQHMLELGGHEMAAGFTAQTDKLPIIQKKLQALAKTQLKNKTLEPQIDIDCQIELRDITWELYNQLQRFQPFGMDNRDPVFCTRQAEISSFRVVGQDQKHLKLKLGDLDAIAFNHGHLAQQLTSGQPIDFAYTLDQNDWNGKKSLQLKVKSIQI